ncbi:MAG: outer membrane lipoprotein-sorting protein, partial [Gemmatimonadetes bacterium]|nr:outer membrane lipoprotein-sorting protein [Gemmatimonadota bacterium]
MKTLNLWMSALAVALAVSVAGAGPAGAEDAAPDAEAIARDAHLNMYYAAGDGTAQVDMHITDRRGKTRERSFAMLRRDTEDGGEQKYFVYFHKPRDVRRTTFMVWKDPAADDARWIFIPALDLIKPISASDKRSSFVGSDFSYEDVSGRHWSADMHTYLREDTERDRPVHVIESTPREDEGFARIVRFIDQEYLLPVREDWYDEDGTVIKTFESLRTEEVDGVRTIVSRRMTSPEDNSFTEVSFREIGYDVGLEDDLFQERYMK